VKTIHSKFQLGDMWALYLLDTETKLCGLALLPEGYQDMLVLDGWWNIEPVVQMKILGDVFPDGFIHGHSMRNTATTKGLLFKNQTVKECGTIKTIVTTLENNGVEATHYLEYEEGTPYMKMYSSVCSHREEPVTLEMLSSFNICAFSGISGELRMEDFVLHRMQSKWSMEGKLESTPFLDLQLEPAWIRIGANSVRFGEVGSMPVRRYFPWMIAEDTKFGYSIGAQLAHPASWQMEVYNIDERVSLSGGLVDREFGHWMKCLTKGEVFERPHAILTVAKEDVDGISHRLTMAQRKNLEQVPEVEKSLPIVFNEYCTTWGNPTEENMLKIIDVLKGKGITYCVIDAGWHMKDGADWSDIGDWIVNRNRFPRGLSYVAEVTKAAGMIPGVWFEMEIVGEDSDIFKKEELLLKCDGYTIQTGRRRFLDMRMQEVQEYLEERVIGRLEQDGFGYLKVDYNDNIGIGCDGAESLGEGLRQNMMGSQKFFRRIRERLPELVIENCSSGGHRLEPSMQALASMASFSDAHEWRAIPVIAANVTRAILPAQSQIWAVLRKTDDEKRLYYSLCNTFLGRMCLSGDVYDLEDWQWKIVEESIRLYKLCAPVIKYGRNYIYGPLNKSYNHLKGWQAVCRVSEDKERMLVVAHTFEGALDTLEILLPGGEKDWKYVEVFCREGISVRVENGRLTAAGMAEYDGFLCFLTGTSCE